MQEDNIIIESNENNKKEECIELKNIKYKTMLLNGNGNTFKETKISNNLSNLDSFLENEKNNNKNEPWCKLDKTVKSIKLIQYVSEYKILNELEEEEENNMIQFLKDCLDRKKLQRVKDVIYDKTTGLIKDIPGLHYVKANRHFTLKNIDKRISTLKSLTPKKVNGTIKNKNNSIREDSDEENEL
jgi:tRNA G10  N-methylase Trm11